MTDELLERRIDDARRALLAARTPQDKHRAGARMTRLLNLRSPAKRREMEREMEREKFGRSLSDG